jgi:hypothetical protein
MCLMTVCRRAKTRSTGDLTSHMVAKLLYNNNNNHAEGLVNPKVRAQKRLLEMFFEKISFFCCIRSKNVADVFHDLKKVKIAEKV